MAADIFRNNRDAYRGAIMYEAKSNSPVEQVYEKMKKVLEDDDLDYVEFEYLYYQLRNNDKQFDGEIVDKRNSSGINDLPILVAKRIASNLDPVLRLYTRTTSRWFRDAINEAPVNHGSFVLRTKADVITLKISSYSIMYQRTELGCLRAKFKNSQLENKDIHYSRGNYVDIAMNDLRGILRNPMFSTEEFIILFNDESDEINKRVIDKMRETLATRNINGIAAKKLIIEVERKEYIAPLLNLFRHTELKDLFINLKFREPQNLDLTFLNQWQDIDILGVRNENFNTTLSSLEELRNFEVIELKCLIPADDHSKLIDVIRTSEKFKRGYVCLPPAIYEEFGTFVGAKEFFPIDDPVDHRILGEEYSITVQRENQSIAIKKMT